ncbi:MAG: AraC family transcriptional regulator [Spirochaetota bacterium]
MTILDVVFVYELSGTQMVRWHSRRHAHSGAQYELHYFLGGDGAFTNGRTRHSVRPGQLFLSVPEQTHEIHPAGEPITYYALLFDVSDDELLREGLAGDEFQGRFPRDLGTHERAFFEAIKNEYALADHYASRAAAHRLAAFLLDLLAGTAPAERRGRRAYNVHVERAIALFQEYVFSHKTLREICLELEITEEYLIRLFRRKMGVTPMRYYQSVKMEAATSLLLNTTMSVKEVSWKLGFASQYHFSRRFKAFSGVSPTEYRTNYYTNNPHEYHVRMLARTAPGD